MIVILLAVASAYLLLRLAGVDTLLLRWWSLIWTVSAAGAAILDDRLWELSSTSLVMFALTLCLGVGAMFAGRPTGVSPPPDPWRDVLSPSAHVALLMVTTLVSFASVHLLLQDLGLGYSIFASLEQLVAAAAAAAIARYQEDFDPEPVTRILLVFMFLSAQLAGWYARRPIAGGSRALWCVLSFLPPLAWTLLLTTKANVLLWMTFFLASWVAFGTGQVRTGPRRRGWLVVGGIAFCALMFGVQLARYGGDLEHSGDDASNALIVAGVGHSFALRDWLERGIQWWPETLGARSFAGVAELLGVATRQIGLYTNDAIDVGPSNTNVYTALRPLVEDFGMLLTGTLFLVLGWLGALLERGAAGRAGSSAMLAVLLSALFWFPITSMFNYNSLIACCVLFAGGAALLRKQ